jgi:hypothetical protein
MVNKIANHRYMYHPSSKHQTDMVNNITNYNNMIHSSEVPTLGLYTRLIYSFTIKSEWLLLNAKW